MHSPDIVLFAVSLAFLEKASPFLVHVHLALAAHQTGDVPVQVGRDAQTELVLDGLLAPITQFGAAR